MAIKISTSALEKFGKALVVASLGLALLAGSGIAHAGGDDLDTAVSSGRCEREGESYSAGTVLQVQNYNIICDGGQWRAYVPAQKVTKATKSASVPNTMPAGSIELPSSFVGRYR